MQEPTPPNEINVNPENDQIFEIGSNHTQNSVQLQLKQDQLQKAAIEQQFQQEKQEDQFLSNVQNHNDNMVEIYLKILEEKKDSIIQEQLNALFASTGRKNINIDDVQKIYLAQSETATLFKFTNDMIKKRGQEMVENIKTKIQESKEKTQLENNIQLQQNVPKKVKIQQKQNQKKQKTVGGVEDNKNEKQNLKRQKKAFKNKLIKSRDFINQILSELPESDNEENED